jgi:hypothetical protein
VGRCTATALIDAFTSIVGAPIWHPLQINRARSSVTAHPASQPDHRRTKSARSGLTEPRRRRLPAIAPSALNRTNLIF